MYKNFYSAYPESQEIGCKPSPIFLRHPVLTIDISIIYWPFIYLKMCLTLISLSNTEYWFFQYMLSIDISFIYWPLINLLYTDHWYQYWIKKSILCTHRIHLLHTEHLYLYSINWPFILTIDISIKYWTWINPLYSEHWYPHNILTIGISIICWPLISL